MDARTRYIFLALILTQAAHSIEEYSFRLYDVFLPARFLSSLVSVNVSLGFIVINTAVVLFGLWSYFAYVMPGQPSAAFGLGSG